MRWWRLGIRRKRQQRGRGRQQRGRGEIQGCSRDLDAGPRVGHGRETAHRRIVGGAKRVANFLYGKGYSDEDSVGVGAGVAVGDRPVEVPDEVGTRSACRRE